jgi:hypothetical protein
VRGGNGRQPAMAPGVSTRKPIASPATRDSLMDIPVPPSSMRWFKWISLRLGHLLLTLLFRFRPHTTLLHPKPVHHLSLSMLKLKPSLWIQLLLLPLLLRWTPQPLIGPTTPPLYPSSPYSPKINLAVIFQLFALVTPTPSAH